MRAPLRPAHLLLLHHPLAYHLVHRRLHKSRRDALAMAIAITIVGNEGFIRRDIAAKLTHGFG
jgi:hypothetical protein